MCDHCYLRDLLSMLRLASVDHTIGGLIRMARIKTFTIFYVFSSKSNLAAFAFVIVDKTCRNIIRRTYATSHLKKYVPNCRALVRGGGGEAPTLWFGIKNGFHFSRLAIFKFWKFIIYIVVLANFLANFIIFIL